MPKPNQDTLWYLLEHLCRSGKLNILFIRERVGWGVPQGLYSNRVKVGKYPRLEQIDETGNFCAGVIIMRVKTFGQHPLGKWGPR